MNFDFMPELSWPLRYPFARGKPPCRFSPGPARVNADENRYSAASVAHGGVLPDHYAGVWRALVIDGCNDAQTISPSSYMK